MRRVSGALGRGQYETIGGSRDSKPKRGKGRGVASDLSLLDAEDKNVLTSSSIQLFPAI